MTSADPDPRADLQSFLSVTMREQGLSYRKIAAGARDPKTGRCLGFQWIGKLASGGLAKAPDAWQLRALAEGLGTPPDVIKALAAQQYLDFDLTVEQIKLGRNEWLLVTVFEGLDDEDRATIEVLARDFLRRQQERGQGQAAGGAPA